MAQTNAQADDLVGKLRTQHPDLVVGRLVGGSYTGALCAGANLLIEKKVVDLRAADVIVGTGAKWGYVDGVQFDLGIIDEAYQMRSDQLLHVTDLFPRALLVGDPGQLDPFTPVDDTRWRGQRDGPVTPAVATVRHNHPDIEPHRLPVSWRLSARWPRWLPNPSIPSCRFEPAPAQRTGHLHHRLRPPETDQALRRSIWRSIWRSIRRSTRRVGRTSNSLVG